MLPEHTLTLQPSGQRGRVAAGTTVLEAARRLGVALESICGGRQTCGKCQISAEADAALSAPTEVEAAYLRDHALVGRRLACATHLVGDAVVTIPPECLARKQVIAKAATPRPVEVQPAVRLVYVELIPAELDAPSGEGDWERLQAALATQWDIPDAQLDYAALLDLNRAIQAPAALRPDGNLGLTVTLWLEHEVLRVQPGYIEGLYGLAVDLGSTTVAAHLCDLRTGAVLATASAVNPQIRFGEDVMSRVSYAQKDPQGAARLNRVLMTTVNKLAQQAAAEAHCAVADIMDVVLVGNPVVLHLALGLDPTPLGGAPFAPALAGPLDVHARDLRLRLNSGARAHVLPVIAGHVGADFMAVLLAEGPHLQDELMLVVDIGTNAEIGLGNRQRLVCASSPTGPAFEGAQITHGQRAAAGAIERVRIDPQTLEPQYRVIGWEEWILPDPNRADPLPNIALATGICGSGLVEVVAELFLAGLLRPDGSFNHAHPSQSPRIRLQGRVSEYVLVDAHASASGQPIVITQKDIRAIQAAKAALYAGVKMLMHQLQVTRVDRIVLAGAFGTYLSPEHAMLLGLIPDCDLARVQAVGNAAGDGACLALLSCEHRATAAELARRVQHVQIATEPTFQDEFVNALSLPHAQDAFPHLTERWPALGATSVAPQRRSRRRLTPTLT